MKLIKIALVVLALSSVSLPNRLSAQIQTSAPALSAGVKIFDQSGAEVGVVDSIANDMVTIDTGTHKGVLPKASVVSTSKGFVVGITREKLDAAVESANAAQAEKLKAQMTTGATVFGSAGAVIGTIKSADAEFVTIATEKGDTKLPIGAFSAGDKGVRIGMTAEAFLKALAGS